MTFLHVIVCWERAQVSILDGLLAGHGLLVRVGCINQAIPVILRVRIQRLALQQPLSSINL